MSLFKVCNNKSVRIDISGLQLRVSRSQNVIYFSIIAMPKKSHFTIFAKQSFVQNTKNTREFHLYCWDHVCKVNEWSLVDCFHREFKVSTQIMVRDYCIAKCKRFSACDELLMALRAILFAIQNIYVNSNPAYPLLNSNLR